jgi:uncharacterized membrane protein
MLPSGEFLRHPAALRMSPGMSCARPKFNHNPPSTDTAEFRRLENALSDDNRSPTIDYLRAISILWVLFYHFVSLKFFSKGTDGVLLFFMISGYCIALSAASSTSCWHFYAKRLGRCCPR